MNQVPVSLHLPSSLEETLGVASPDPYVLHLEGGAHGGARVLTYTSSNAMVRRMDVPAFVPLHFAEAAGAFAPVADRYVFALDERAADELARRGHPRPQPLPDWALRTVSGAGAFGGAEVWAPEIWPLPSSERRPEYLLLCTIRRADRRLVTAAFFTDDLRGAWRGVDQRTASERIAGVPARPGLLLASDAVGLIDCTLFVHPETRRMYLLWKEDGNDVARPCLLRMQEVRRDGDRLELFGPRWIAARNRPRSWQGAVVEGAAFYWDAATGSTWIIISGNDCYGPHYAMGAIRVFFEDGGARVRFRSLPDPIMDNSHPLLVARDEVGAGHASIQPGRITFHVWRRTARMGVELDDRQARSATFGLRDGVPSIGHCPPTARNARFARALERRLTATTGYRASTAAGSGVLRHP